MRAVSASHYMLLEVDIGERLICANEHFVVIVPFWAVWPYETMVISRRQAGTLTDLDTGERASLADIVKSLVVLYDNIYQCHSPIRWACTRPQQMVDLTLNGTCICISTPRSYDPQRCESS